MASKLPANFNWTSFLQDLPKCEHHLHLEGCLTPKTLFELAKKNNITLPNSPEYASEETLNEFYKHFTCLDDFLKAYYCGMSVLIEQSDFEELAWSYFQKAKADGVVHAEVFFDPQSHTDRGISFDTVVNGFSAACKRATSELGITTRLIMCFQRNHSVESAWNTYNAAKNGGYLGPDVSGDDARDDENRVIAGLGLDSTEIGYPAELFTEIYEDAAKRGLRRTAHGGEEGDPSYIKGALDSLTCERIDHGIRIVEDSEILQRAIDNQIMLTVCPLSNVCLKATPTVKNLPLREFLKKDVKFSINSDDPAYFGGFILDNFLAVQEAFNLDWTDWVTISVNAIEGSWINDARKLQLVQLLDKVIEKHIGPGARYK